MADRQENPLSRQEFPLSDTTQHSTVPRTLDDAVYLPESRRIDPAGPEFEQLLQQNLPAEIAPDVMARWRGLTRRPTRLQWFGAVFFLLAAGVLLWYFFPRTVHAAPVQQRDMEIADIFPKLRSNSPYRGDYDRAEAAFRRGDYHEVVKILKPCTMEIIRSDSQRESGKLLYLYFGAVQQLKSNSGGSREIVEQLRSLRENDPDNPVWAQFAFKLDPRVRRARDYQSVRRQLRQNPAYRRLRKHHLDEVEHALKELRNLRGLANPAKYSAAKLKQYRENFDLYEIQLRLSRWLLLGSERGASLPDNRDDPGVSDRETALGIAQKYPNTPIADFWQARRFIAITLCEEDSLFNHIYWNGEFQKTQDSLKREIEICDQRLNRKAMP